MASDKNKRKLRNLLINYSFQHRVVVVNLLFMVLVLILTMSIIYTHLFEKQNGLEGIWNFPMGELTMSISPKTNYPLYSPFYYLSARNNYSALDDPQGVRTTGQFL